MKSTEVQTHCVKAMKYSVYYPHFNILCMYVLVHAYVSVHAYEAPLISMGCDVLTTDNSNMISSISE